MKMKTSHNKRKVEHRLFLVGVWIKGLAGVVETIGVFLFSLSLRGYSTLLFSFLLCEILHVCPLQTFVCDLQVLELLARMFQPS